MCVHALRLSTETTMAANKFASMLHKNCHKIIVILVYAVLEWILILLLLLNSLFSYLIAKFAKFFGLKPSCTWCSRLDHIFNSKTSSKNPYLDHVCEAHGTQISKMSYCSTHKKLAESKSLCVCCSSSRPADYGTINDIASTVAFFTWTSENASEGGDGTDRCSCCDQILTTKVYPPQSLIFKPTWDILLEYFHKNKVDFGADLVKKETEFQENGRDDDDANDDPFEKDDDGGKKTEIAEDSNLEVQEWSSSQATDDPFWNQGCNEDEESVFIADMLLQSAESMDSDRFICIELIDTDAAAAAAATEMPLTNSSEENQHEIDGAEAERVEIPHKILEVENEEKDYNLAEVNNCAETESFVEESMKSGNRERTSEMEAQEKAQALINALYAEVEEERKAAAEAAVETMAMITKLQEEKAAIQMEAVQYQRMMEEQAEYDQEALQLLNDLMLKRDNEKKALDRELQIYRAKVLDYEAREKMVLTTTSTPNGSLARTASNASSTNSTPSIDLDEYDDLDEEMEETFMNNSIIPDISLAEFDEERVSILEELKALEAKLFALHVHDDDDPIPMAKKLLPLFDGAENEDGDKEEMSAQSASMLDNNGSRVLLQEEIGHVYERLQALEADKDFLKHCIRSMVKGNQGVALLQEILQHLRDLKSAELSATNLAGVPLSDASMADEDHQQ